MPAVLPILARVQARITEAQQIASTITKRFPRKPSRRFNKAHTLLTLSQAQALLLRYTDLGVQFVEGERLQTYVNDAQEWCRDSEACLGQATSLDRLQGLLSRATLIPVDLTQERERLGSKLQEANAWVARVRSAVPRKRTRRGLDGEMLELSKLEGLMQVRWGEGGLEGLSGVPRVFCFCFCFCFFLRMKAVFDGFVWGVARCAVL